MQFPNFGYRSTSHVRLRPDDRPHVDDGPISTAWNARTLPSIHSRLNENLRKPRFYWQECRQDRSQRVRNWLPAPETAGSTKHPTDNPPSA